MRYCPSPGGFSGGPILAVFIGLIAFFVGVADIKDKIEAKKEEEEDKAAEAKPADKKGGE
jgi:hypothetical protein